MSDLRPEVLSWTALLGRWIDYARASLALPDDGEGLRWKQSVPAVIKLQAATFALGELTQLNIDDQAMAVDRAAVLIDGAQREVVENWSGVDQPPSLQEIVSDAQSALKRAAMIAHGWELVWRGRDDAPGSELPGGGLPGVMPIVDLPERAQTLLVMMPGSLVMPGEPVAFGRCIEPLELEGAELASRHEPRQVYRAIDDDGRIVGDAVKTIDDDEPPAGLPLLVPIIVDGNPLGEFPLEADEWLARQRAGLSEHMTIRVEVASP